MMNKLYLLVGVAVLGVYTAGTFLGWEVGGYGRESAAASTARHASGGHRSVWIMGYLGGK
jgi:hypothetical protein